MTTSKELYKEIFLHYLKKGYEEEEADKIAKRVVKRELERGTLKKNKSP